MAAKALTSKSLKTNNLGGFMEVKELRDLIQEIHDSGDCGQALSEALEIANKICGQLSDLEIVQKALELTGLDMLCTGSSYVVADHCSSDEVSTDGHYFNNSTELLTWAKQQIGVE